MRLRAISLTIKQNAELELLVNGDLESKFFIYV
jgi:hypothetical protein